MRVDVRWRISAASEKIGQRFFRADVMRLHTIQFLC